MKDERSGSRVWMTVIEESSEEEVCTGYSQAPSRSSWMISVTGEHGKESERIGEQEEGTEWVTRDDD